MNLNKLIRQVRLGDVDAYRHIVRRYAPEVRRYLALRIADPHTVEDVTQEVMIAAYWKLSKFDSKRDFGAWVQGIAKNKFKEFLRSCRTHKESVIRDSVPLMEHLDGQFNGHRSEPAKLKKLKFCIEKLPETLKILVRRRFLDKESVQDIAEEQGVTVSAVSSSLYRAKKQLRLCVGGR